MRLPRPVLLLARLAFCVFVLLSSLYCLLAYIPFTYEQIHKGDLLASLSAFVRVHCFLYWAALLVAAFTLVDDLRQVGTRTLTAGFLVFYGGFGIRLLFHPLLPGLQNEASSLLWSFLSLTPLLWIAVIDGLGQAHKIQWNSQEGGHTAHTFRAAWQSAVFLTLLYAGVCYLRHILKSDAVLRGPELFLSQAWSLICHLLVFMGLFVILNLIEAISSLFSKPSKAEFFSCHVLTATLMWLALTRVVLPPISFVGGWAHLFAAALALSLAAYFGGISLRLRSANEPAVDSGLALVLTPVTLGRISSRPRWVLVILALASAAYGLAAETAALDWNYLLQKITVALIWVATFACFYAWTPQKTRRCTRATLFLVIAIAVLGMFKTLQASAQHWWVWMARPTSQPEMVFERYAGYDVSFQLARTILAPPRAEQSLYPFLTQNTNIPRSIRVAPVEVNLVERVVGGQRPQPNIFVFVIDSLRRDYLSPYNKDVTFTPSIEGFARENVVMENAFTCYGGTGLSEPSIWVGGMLLHKQYITPFAPMNALQKLLEAEQYQSFVSIDSILHTVVTPSPLVTPLDEGVATMNLELGHTLGELKEKISHAPGGSRPVFAYTQPQNLHISVINRQGSSIPAGESYPGFYAPYASRIRKLDACFGDFIEFLKARKLYDNSIVILTSDHGDSLGEEGRWGHAYTIFPEIIKIPMIIHLPSNMRQSVVCDPGSVAFLTDITPSLYYLLGHKPVLRSQVFGRPLFTATQLEASEYRRDSHLIASSYGAVYGILYDHGQQLYISDGVNYKDYFFDLTNGPAGTSHPVTGVVKGQNEKLIREQIQAISRFYGFHPEQ
jgi:phosphoglycerol transferase MdoB-like AlkP superfamily enzyme